VTGFTTLPLRVASFIGFGFSLFGFATLGYTIGRYFIHGGSVPGFPFLASIISIFSGTQLFALGILGEYLARMHFRLMDRPSYAIHYSADRNRNESEVERPEPNHSGHLAKATQGPVSSIAAVSSRDL
jgi:hypothetical protein